MSLEVKKQRSEEVSGWKKKKKKEKLVHKNRFKRE